MSCVFFIMQIHAGRVQVIYHLGVREEELSLSAVPVSDGRWHSVKSHRAHRQVTLAVDGGEGRSYNYSHGNKASAATVGLDIGRLIYAGAGLSYPQDVRVVTGDLTNGKCAMCIIWAAFLVQHGLVCRSAFPVGVLWFVVY